MRRFIPLSALLLLPFAVCGCPGSGNDLVDEMMVPDDDPVIDMGTLSYIQENVFVPFCVDCHRLGGQAEIIMRLDDEQTSAANLINVPSIFCMGGIPRVTPGDPENSCLVWKVEGRPEAGRPMPLNLPPLSQENIDAIIEWIADGAPP